MKYSTIVGVYADIYPNPSTLPMHPICLCLEHQDTDLPRAPFKFPINALQAYYARAHCAECGRYLGLPEEQAESPSPALESQPRERVAVLPDYEMHLLVSVLRRIAAYFGGRVCDDLEFAAILPELPARQAIMQRFHEWNGDPEVWQEDLAVGSNFAQCRFWTYGAALAYFAHRLAPDIEQALRKAERD